MPSAQPPAPPADPIVDAAAWAAVKAAAPVVDVASLATHGSRLLVVSPHPDDETIGAGRLVAAWAARIGPVDAIVLTAGEACFGDTGAAADAVGRLRLAEWESAVTALGGVPHGCAHLPDHRLGAHHDTVVDILTALAPAADAIAVTWSGDSHPDHAAAGRAAEAVAARTGIRLLSYPVWFTYRNPPGDIDLALTRVTTDPAADAARVRALACYPSQLTGSAGRPAVVDADMLAHHETQLLVQADR